MSRYRDPQLRVGEKFSHKYVQFKSKRIPIYQIYFSFLTQIILFENGSRRDNMGTENDQIPTSETYWKFFFTNKNNNIIFEDAYKQKIILINS